MSLFQRPCDSSEILLLLEEMNTSKASGPNSIPMKLLKQFNNFNNDVIIELIL